MVAFEFEGTFLVSLSACPEPAFKAEETEQEAKHLRYLDLTGGFQGTEVTSSALSAGIAMAAYCFASDSTSC
jgi:hypothetical protein